MKRSHLTATFFLMIILCLGFYLKAFALENARELHLDQATVAKGYTVATPDGNLKIAIWPDAFNQEVGLVLKSREFAEVGVPETKNLISDFYEFEIKGDDLTINQPFTLQLSYTSDNDSFKAIYFYNYTTKIWSRVEPSIIFEKEKFIRAVLKIPYALFAILEEKPLFGKASWYRHKDCDCAASPDYPKGTLLKVTNLDNEESLIVEVNDYGPDRDIHPDRVVDLDVTAFKQIADKQIGIIDVKVEKISP